MPAGYIIAESMRPGTQLQGIPPRLTSVERHAVKNPAPDQPSVWTTIEFEFPGKEAERVADALAEVLQEHGGWYTDFELGGEEFVIFPRRIFRYGRGDEAARAKAQAYGRSVGVPAPQLDWAD
jgi:hypothetical protein